MPTKPAKLRPSSKQSSLKAARSNPRALIPIDGKPIRKKARKAYEKARRDLDHARVQIEEFRTQHQPAFQRWINTNFGSQLTALRELREQVSEQQRLIAEVENYMWDHDVSEAVAYAAVQHRREQPVEADPKPAPDDNDDPGPGDTHAKARFKDLSDEEAYEKFAHAFEEVFGERLPPGFRPPKPSAKPTPTASVKDLYRTLVRKLHPDKQATMTAQMLEWWHEVQDAYAHNDTERLALILSQIELSQGETTAHTSVAMFQKLAAQIKVSLRELKREITQLRRDPAWKFSQGTEHGLLTHQTRFEFEEALGQLRLSFVSNEAVLRDWAEQATLWKERHARATSKTSTKRRSSPGQKEFGF